MIIEEVKVKGNLSIDLIDQNQNIIDSRKINNLVVTVGKNYLASRATSNSSAIMSHMAVGSQNTAPVVGETALGSELGRVVLDSTNVTGNSISYVATFPAGTGTGALTEAGIFNAGTSGTLLCRTQFNAINKSPTDAIVITWNVIIN